MKVQANHSTTPSNHFFSPQSHGRNPASLQCGGLKALRTPLDFCWPSSLLRPPCAQVGELWLPFTAPASPCQQQGFPEQRQTQEAASLAPSSLDLTGTEGPPDLFLLPASRLLPLSIPSVSGACCPQAVAWPWPPRGLGLTASPSLGSAPCPLPFQHPPQVQSVDSANQSHAKVGQRGGRGSRD